MRGKQLVARGGLDRVRITPADAGKTRVAYSAMGDTLDHPRGCGENMKPSLHGTTGTGSPPRMRGKHEVATDSFGAEGITPADAGKTTFRL